MLVTEVILVWFGPFLGLAITHNLQTICALLLEEFTKKQRQVTPDSCCNWIVTDVCRISQAACLRNRSCEIPYRFLLVTLHTAGTDVVTTKSFTGRGIGAKCLFFDFSEDTKTAMLIESGLR